MDSLLAGTLILPWRVHCAGVMSSAAVPAKSLRAFSKSNGLHPDRKCRVLADVTNVRIGIGDSLGPIEDAIALVQLMRNPRRMLPINRERSQRRCARPVPAKADDDVIKIFQRVLRAPHCL